MLETRKVGNNTQGAFRKPASIRYTCNRYALLRKYSFGPSPKGGAEPAWPPLNLPLIVMLINWSC